MDRDKVRELLVKLRGRLAYAKVCEPYKIFNNENLEALLDARPKTIQELSTIKGFPMDGKRVAAYGQAIIDVFNKTDQVEEFDVKLDNEGEPVATSILRKMTVF